MSVLTSTKRADAFAAMLDTTGRTDDPTIAPMLTVTAALLRLPTAPGPQPQFRAALRQRLVAVATVQGVGEPAPSTARRVREAGATWRVQRRLAAAGAGLALVTTGVGIGIGAHRALPGDAFYGLKRTTEQVQLDATRGNLARGKRHLEFARTRLAEVRALAAHASAVGAYPTGASGHALALGPVAPDGRAALIASTLRAMDAQTNAGVADLLAAYRSSASIEPLRLIDEFTAEQYAALSRMFGSLPVVTQLRAQQSLTLLRTVAAQTGVVEKATGTPSATPQTPGPTATQPATPAAAPTPGSGSSTGPSGSAKPGLGSATPIAPAPSVPTIPSLPLPTLLPVPSSLPPVPTSLLP